MSKTVLLTREIHPRGIEFLSEDFEVRIAPDPSPDTVRKEIQGVQGILVRNMELSEDLIEAGKELEVIGRHGAGYDNVDIRAATARGIPVVYAPGVNSLSVAEHTLTLSGVLLKRIFSFDAAVRRGDFDKRNSFSAREVRDKTLGILGVGRVGSLVCKKSLSAFGVTILAYDPYVPDARLRKLGATPCGTKEEVLRSSDLLTLHVNLTEETAGFIGARELAIMPDHAFLINTSRGEVVCEEALVSALEEGEIAGAALDVYATEPPPADHPLLAMDNVILTPHTAGLTLEAVTGVALTTARGMRDVLFGKRPEHMVNPEVYAGEEV